MGTWDYAFLGRVPAAEHSLRRMESLLAGPLCGWPRDRMLTLPNVLSPGDLPDQLITAFDTVTDVAVFYFVGHGQISPDDQLCLGLVQSRPEANRRAATSLRFPDVRQALQDSTATVKIVILDCCFAGQATKEILAGLAGNVLDDLTAGTGAYTMAATGAYATAWYQDEPGLAEPQTYFTKHLADLVEAGIPGQPTGLRLDPLFRQLKDNLTAAGRPVPHRRAVNDAREFVFAYNAAPPATHRDPEQELAKLGLRLAETESLRVAANAQVSALTAEVADRARELARLKELLAASTRSRDAGQQRELQGAVEEAARQLDDSRSAQAAGIIGGQRGGPQVARTARFPAQGAADRAGTVALSADAAQVFGRTTAVAEVAIVDDFAESGVREPGVRAEQPSASTDTPTTPYLPLDATPLYQEVPFWRLPFWQALFWRAPDRPDRLYMYKPTAQIEWAISGIIIGVILWIFFAVPFYFPLTVIAMAIAVPTAYLILTPMSSLRSQHAERQMRHRRLHKRLKSLKRRISS
ncbi:MAG TPA: hypothetical protein VHO07_07065 [Streptosporangiaceae bacterium]|nr:hypothetical protein [Streptosporangiaceae bacterium]